jgi:hypothetical protein
MSDNSNDPDYRKRLVADIYLNEYQGAYQLAALVLKSAIILNGAAAIAALAFVGQVITNGEALARANEALNGITISSLFFGVGVFLGGAATGIAYFRSYFATVYINGWLQGEEPNKRHKLVAERIQYFAIALTVLSYFAFGAGLWKAGSALAKVVCH